jgi:hypothetical protein
LQDFFKLLVAFSFPAATFLLPLFSGRCAPCPASLRLTKPYTAITVGVLLANVVGAPMAAGFLLLDGLGGLHGWQWLFL